MNNRKCPTCSEIDKFNLIGTMLNCAKCGCEIHLQEYEERITNQPTKWVPSQEELVSLGFEKRDGFYEISFEDKCFDAASIFYNVRGNFGISVNSTEEHLSEFYVNPKSLEELKTLLSMMNP